MCMVVCMIVYDFPLIIFNKNWMILSKPVFFCHPVYVVAVSALTAIRKKEKALDNIWSRLLLSRVHKVILPNVRCTA